MSAADDTALPQARIDLIPIALVGAIALAAFAMIGSGSTWVTLTVAGLAMGLLILSCRPA